MLKKLLAKWLKWNFKPETFFTVSDHQFQYATVNGTVRYYRATGLLTIYLPDGSSCSSRFIINTDNGFQGLQFVDLDLEPVPSEVYKAVTSRLTEHYNATARSICNEPFSITVSNRVIVSVGK